MRVAVKYKKISNNIRAIHFDKEMHIIILYYILKKLYFEKKIGIDILIICL